MSKPRMGKAVGSGLWFCFNIITDERQRSIVGIGDTPEEAYNSYVRGRDKGFSITITPPDTITYKPKRWWEIWR